MSSPGDYRAQTKKKKKTFSFIILISSNKQRNYLDLKFYYSDIHTIINFYDMKAVTARGINVITIGTDCARHIMPRRYIEGWRSTGIQDVWAG